MKYLGKIDSIKFGIGGYQDSMLGLHLNFSFDKCCGTGTSISFWDFELIKWSDRCKWTEESRDKSASDLMRKISKLLNEAKCSDVYQLKGKPVEIDMGDDGNKLVDWRILTEVL